MDGRVEPGHDDYALTGRSFAVRAADHDDIAIRIAQPHFPVLRRRIDKRLFNHLGLQSARTPHSGIEIVQLKPEHDTMGNRRRGAIHKVRMIFLVPGVKLKNDLAGYGDPVIGIAMGMVGQRVCAKERSVPRTTGTNIFHSDERLRFDA